MTATSYKVKKAVEQGVLGKPRRCELCCKEKDIPHWHAALIANVRSQMAARGHTQTEAAAEIGVAQPTLNMWLNYRARPNRESEALLRRYAGGEI